jgi:hypothetical protein
LLDLPACAVSDAAIDALVALLRLPDLQAPTGTIPAGYTYLGQFIDHDITFNPRPGLDGVEEPRENLRTPRLDLDSLYGGGPVAHPFLYDWDATPEGVRLLVGRSDGVADLPRNAQGFALTGDPRNDEHAILTQLHLLFIRFHNAVVGRLEDSGVGEAELFSQARRIVREHYRWLVLHDFLPRVAGDVDPEGSHFAFGEDGPYIPDEFSGAAFRFGHSLVRAQYGLRRRVPGAGPVHAVPLFPDLAGFTPLTRRLVIDWERFFRLPGDGAQVQASQSINPRLAGPLFHLPTGEPELARRTLRRGRELGLPCGQAVAEAFDAAPLSDEELHLSEVPPAVAAELREGAPLWFYLLCEAEARAGGRRLGPVGARIVADVLRAVAAPDGEPRVGELGTGNRFDMATLIEFVSVAK